MLNRFIKHSVPDLPQPFGYNVSWLALRTIETKAVIESLGIKTPKVATWQDGISEAYDSAVFITPPLASWTLAVGVPLLPPDEPSGFVKPLIERLSGRFNEAQFFCTNHIVEYHTWARAVQGRLLRGYGYIGEKGETLWDEGAQTKEEIDLGFKFYDERSAEAKQENYWDRKDLTFPNEGCVMRLAGRWSIDPTKLEERFREPSLGTLGTL